MFSGLEIQVTPNPDRRFVWLDCRRLIEYCTQNKVILPGAFHSLQLEVIMETPSIRIRRVLLENLRLRLQQAAKYDDSIIPASVEDFISEEDPNMEQVRAQLVRIRRVLSACASESIFGSMQTSSKRKSDESEIKKLLDEIEVLSKRTIPNSILGNS